jgi:hypothetical protein
VRAGEGLRDEGLRDERRTPELLNRKAGEGNKGATRLRQAYDGQRTEQSKPVMG